MWTIVHTQAMTARAWIEPPEQTRGSVQLLLTALRKLGYSADGPVSRLLIS